MKVDDEASIAAKKAAAKVMGFAQCVVRFPESEFVRRVESLCDTYSCYALQLLVFSIDLGGMATSLWQPCKCVALHATT